MINKDFDLNWAHDVGIKGSRREVAAAQAHELLGFPWYLNPINFILGFQGSLLRP